MLLLSFVTCCCLCVQQQKLELTAKNPTPKASARLLWVNVVYSISSTYYCPITKLSPVLWNVAGLWVWNINELASVPVLWILCLFYTAGLKLVCFFHWKWTFRSMFYKGTWLKYYFLMWSDVQRGRAEKRDGVLWLLRHVLSSWELSKK